MEYRENPVLYEVGNKGGARLEVGNLQVEHVRVVAALRRDVGELQIACIGERLQLFAVGVPAGHTIVENLLRVLEFGVQVGRVEFAGQVA